jgi:hypothetical protein
MKTSLIIKKTYQVPCVECILLDNEISLILQSDETPPTFEYSSLSSKDVFNNQSMNELIV